MTVVWFHPLFSLENKINAVTCHCKKKSVKIATKHWWWEKNNKVVNSQRRIYSLNSIPVKQHTDAMATSSVKDPKTEATARTGISFTAGGEGQGGRHELEVLLPLHRWGRRYLLYSWTTSRCWHRSRCRSCPAPHSGMSRCFSSRRTAGGWTVLVAGSPRSRSFLCPAEGFCWGTTGTVAENPPLPCSKTSGQPQRSSLLHHNPNLWSQGRWPGLLETLWMKEEAIIHIVKQCAPELNGSYQFVEESVCCVQAGLRCSLGTAANPCARPEWAEP